MSPPESRRKKLQALLRSRAQGLISSASDLLLGHGHSGINRAPGAAETAHAATPISPAQPLPPVTMAECGGSLASCPDGAPYWSIRRTLHEVAPECMSVSQEYAAVMHGARQRFDELEASAALCCAADARPEDLLFMDIETCGLGGTGIFLIGVMFFDVACGQLVFEQYFARDYSEEPAILHAFLEQYAGRFTLLVTFNGKAFDMTQISERAAFHAVNWPDRPLPHLDLLHEARKRWRGKIPNCKLQTLERHFCGRYRIGDIPGFAIPDAYHRFVQSNDARQVRDILHHNLLDLLTMAQLIVVILTSCDPEATEAETAAEDVSAAGVPPEPKPLPEQFPDML